MITNFKVNSDEIDKIKKISKKEKEFRIKNLNLFNKNGFPNNKIEDWKFSDLRNIVSKNFKKLDVQITNSKNINTTLIKDFEHNSLILINGNLSSSNFDFEEKNKIKIKNFHNDNFSDINKYNPLIHLNHALSDTGYYLEIADNYKFKKTLIIYNIFTKELNENILNSRNKIQIGNNSELHTIDFVVNESKKKFMNNVYENVILKENAIYKNICIQNEKVMVFSINFQRIHYLLNLNIHHLFFHQD